MKGTGSALRKDEDTEEWGLWELSSYLFLTVWPVGHLGRLLKIEALTLPFILWCFLCLYISKTLDDCRDTESWGEVKADGRS